LSNSENGMRVTLHNGRAGKNGVFSPKHADRDFDTSKADHIENGKFDRKTMSYNVYGDYDLTFDEVEEKFYTQFLKKGFDKQNEKHILNRHPSRVKTIEQYRKTKRFCPEETLYYIGNRDNTVSDELFSDILAEQIVWESKTFPNVIILNAAFHPDELGATHLELRKVYLARDDDGDLIVHQEKALEEMGIERPDQDRKSGQHNNRKMTYTKMCRDHYIELCKSYGLEIIEEPRKKSESGKQLDAYIRDKELKQIEEGKTFLNDKEVELKTIGELQNKREEEFQAREDKLEAQEKVSADKLSEAEEILKGAINYYRESKSYYVDNQAAASDEAKKRIRKSRIEFERQMQRGEDLKHKLKDVNKGRDREKELQ